MLTLAVVVIAGIYFMTSCSKDDTKSSNSSNPSLSQTKKEMKLVAEITMDTTYERLELLDFGNIYESDWNKRVFENGIFQYDINYISSVFNTKFAVISCKDDCITIETEEGDTISLFNITSDGGIVTFDMLRDDKKPVHFKFTTGQDIDFVKGLQLAIDANNTKVAWLVVCAVVGTVASVATLAVTIVSVAKDKYYRECDIKKRNGERDCTTWGCGVREGDCCVWCVGGDAYPNCKKDGAVRGDGSDCNNH